MHKSSAMLKVVAGKDHPLDRETLARRFRESMAVHLSAHTEGTNVNSSTLLATDYLNHFNEMIMLLYLLPSAPSDIAPELGNWRHLSYEDHFHETGFRDKSLAIACYKNAPEDVREAFDTAIDSLEFEMVKVLDQVSSIMASGSIDGLQPLCMSAAPRLRDMVDLAAAIVNGEEADVSATIRDPQDSVDELFK